MVRVCVVLSPRPISILFLFKCVVLVIGVVEDVDDGGSVQLSAVFAV